jgi:ubiquinone/menaquinone biosynthesis C-methylase UbiE
MFTKSAEFYDRIYHWKDYAGEAAKVHALIQQHKQTDSSELLDVACGTGGHFPYLRDHYQLAGLDLDEGMLAVARQRFPNVPFYHGDMRDFDLDQPYDVIICLFSAIAYVVTLEGLQNTLNTFYRHLKPGGVAIIEGFIKPEQWLDRHIGALFIDDPELKIARMNHNVRVGNQVALHFHYLVGTPAGVEHMTEEHTLTVFTDAEYLAALQQARFEATLIEDGLMPERGLFVGVRPLH